VELDRGGIMHLDLIQQVALRIPLYSRCPPGWEYGVSNDDLQTSLLSLTLSLRESYS